MLLLTTAVLRAAEYLLLTDSRGCGCDRAQIHDALRRPAFTGGKQVRNVPGDHHNVVACGIARIFRRVSDRKFRKKFRGLKIFGPKSRINASKIRAAW